MNEIRSRRRVLSATVGASTSLRCRARTIDLRTWRRVPPWRSQGRKKGASRRTRVPQFSLSPQGLSRERSPSADRIEGHRDPRRGPVGPGGRAGASYVGATRRLLCIVGGPGGGAPTVGARHRLLHASAVSGPSRRAGPLRRDWSGNCTAMAGEPVFGERCSIPHSLFPARTSPAPAIDPAPYTTDAHRSGSRRELRCSRE